MNQKTALKTSLVWEGITIQVRHQTQYHGMSDLHHIDIKATEPPLAKLPITNTGYLSHFYHGDPVADVSAAVLKWLDEEAEAPEWKSFIATQQQLSLFDL